jgi:hypothetical protein
VSDLPEPGPAWRVDHVLPLVIIYGLCPMPVLSGMKWPLCMRPMPGCAIRSYLATAAKHGIGMLDALTRAASGAAWVPGTA